MTGASSSVPDPARPASPTPPELMLATIRDLTDAELEDVRTIDALRLHSAQVGRRLIETFHAPFDHINRTARICIVGLTPGRHQAQLALRTCRDALRAGSGMAEALRSAKSTASFAGPLRGNLVAMLDSIGVPAFLDISTTLQLWVDRTDLVHFTSILRDPVFVDGENWSGTPDALSIPFLRERIEETMTAEFADLPGCLFVPLGPKVTGVLLHLASIGVMPPESVLDGMPHPSGANAERVACFLGRKPPAAASAKTDGVRLLASQALLRSRLAKQSERR